MKFVLKNQNRLIWASGNCRAAIGVGGLVPLADKREGDGASPIGQFVFRRALYRADRIARPQCILTTTKIVEQDGWCDQPNDPAYNRPVVLPYPASAESLFRQDHVYDLLIVLGHNDRPPLAKMGSAIFLHLARENYPPTRGCIAIAKPDFLDILQLVEKKSSLSILSS